LDVAHILTLNCNEMAGDRPRQPAYEIFSIERIFQQRKSHLLSSRWPAQTGFKDGYPLKVVILPQLCRLTCKRLQTCCLS